MKPLGKVALVLLAVSTAGSAAYWLRTWHAPLEQPTTTGSAGSAPVNAEELRLVKGAEAALGNGDTDLAFSLLYEHATKFPKGQLAVLRQLVHIQTLCRVGKTAEAREETADFLVQSPNSPLAMRVKSACSSSP